MHLIDCFDPPISYVLRIRQAPERCLAEVEQVSSDLEAMLRQSEAAALRGNVSAQDYREACFAVCAWIDETILGSSWKFGPLWLKEQLQRRYYGTSNAGEEYFARLESLGPQQMEVREVYTLCLALGFTGRYCNPDDKPELDRVRSAQLTILYGDTTPSLQGSDGVLFPQASPPDLPSSPKRKAAYPAVTLGVAVAALAPLALLVILFLVFRFVLSGVSDNLLRSLPH